MRKRTIFSIEKNVFLLISALFLMVGICNSSVINVPGDASRIQEAVDNAATGDVIVVAPGTYYETINLTGRDITLRSTDPDDPEIVKTTVISSDNDEAAIIFAGIESQACIIEGFTITNINGLGIDGNEASATIRKNRIIDNYYSGMYSIYGVIEKNIISNNRDYGIFGSHGRILNNIITENGNSGLNECSGTIASNTITSNTGDQGGGLTKCEGIIRDCTIRGNSAKAWGGGIYSHEGDIINNVIEDNYSDAGGGAIAYCRKGLVKDNLISNNSTDGSGAVAYECSKLYFDRNTIKNNYAKLYGGVFLRCEDGVVENNEISDNYCGESGGVFSDCNLNVKNNKIRNNVAVWNGGAFSYCEGEISNNIITGNDAILGGAFSHCDADIHNNVIYGNIAAIGGAFAGCQADIQNCIIRDNPAYYGGEIYKSTPPQYSCLSTSMEGGTGNIVTDPLFVDPDIGNFHLGSDSPCIDAGNPDPEYNDGCLPPGKISERNDMGAYGGPENCNWKFFIPSGDLACLTSYGDVWASDNPGAPPMDNPSRREWLGYLFDPENNYYVLSGNADGLETEDLIQVTEYGDVWVSMTTETEYTKPNRWGWLGFSYVENGTERGNIPLAGDVNGDGSDDLIQVTLHGDAWVALSEETRYGDPSRWGWLGYSFRRGEPGQNGSIPLTGDADGDGNDDLIQITGYGDAWVALSEETRYGAPKRWGWPGFNYAPFDGLYPLSGDVDGDGLDDLIQITPTGDPWVALSTGNGYGASSRWGWSDFYYDEENGYYPMTGDVNVDGMDDLIMITPSGEILVAASKGDSFDYPENWGKPGFLYNRESGFLPFYLDF